MSVDLRHGEPGGRHARGPTLVGRATYGLLALAGAVVGAGVIAYLVTAGAWYLALGALAVVPGMVLLHHRPMLAVTAWLVVTPLVVVSDSAVARKLYWVVHRGLPVLAVVMVVLVAKSAAHRRPLPRLGLPEGLMAGYVFATLVSIVYTSTDVGRNVIQLYDFVVAPMLLYLFLRLLEPDERQVRGVAGAVVFVLVFQTVVGMLSWVAPGVLPSEWLGKLGERTVGSLRSPDVYGTTVLFCGAFLLHMGASRRARSITASALFLFALGLTMAFMTFSRASWIAAAVVLIGALLTYKGLWSRLAVMAFPLVLFAAASGFAAQQVDHARERIESPVARESALSRLPVVYASVRMFEAKPLTGWGYGNFDRYDRQFQRPVGNLFYPDKDHASHNVYLTLAAEQGVVGIVLFLGPAAVLLARTIARWRRLPGDGVLDRRFVAAMWAVIAAHVVVNNFSRMQVPFGLGMWWVTLGLIATVVERVPRADGRPEVAA
ncbi:MAG: hypothetical protein KatS3mg009_1890 [Acidimicrobiia bacterium]|nr:MAG: hypothetical protein KatS3mg009_1890 [Acidimicrobiia bacterium]